MRRTSPFLVACATVLVLVGAVALGARNSSGTYSLPSGNPVVSGTTITSSWANSTLSDLGTEVTNSLDRYGRGAMLAQLKAIDGTVSSPGISFSSEQTSGLYRASAGNVRLAVTSADAQTWTASGSAIALPLTCSEGVTITNSVTNGAGITATGNGTADGIKGTGGSSNGNGVEGVAVGSGDGVKGVAASATGYAVHGIGALDGFGVVGSATGTGEGGDFTGGSNSGVGVTGRGGAGSGIGVRGYGGGTGEGGHFIAGGSGTNAVVLQGGDLQFTSTANAGTAAANTLAPTNLVKEWAHLTATSGSWAVTSGFNVSSASALTDTLTVTVSVAFASAEGAILITPSGNTGNLANATCNARIASTTTVSVHCYDDTGAAITLASVATSGGLNILVLGAQ